MTDSLIPTPHVPTSPTPPPSPDDAPLTAIDRVLSLIDSATKSPGLVEIGDALGLGVHPDDNNPQDRKRLFDLLVTLAIGGEIVPDFDGGYRRQDRRDVVGRVSLGNSRHFAMIIPAKKAITPVKVHRRDLAGAREGDLVHARILDDRHPDVSEEELDDLEARDELPSYARQKGGHDKRGRGGKYGKRSHKDRRKGPPGKEVDGDLWYWASIEQILRKRNPRLIGIFDSGSKKHGPVVRLLHRNAGGFLPVIGNLPEGAKDGAIVDVEVLRGSAKDEDRREGGLDKARVHEVLGYFGDPTDDELTVIAEYGLRMQYDPAAERELDDLLERYEADVARGVAQANREDLTHLRTLTIDPADARDHDDAVSLEMHDDGTFTLGVHIADVSHFVPAGSALDAEARARGSTVYFPVRTLHMLPPRLAREVCSLTVGDAKLAKSCLIHFDRKGRVLDRRLVRSVVKIDHFLNYGQALRILRAEMTDEETEAYPEWLPDYVRDMRDAADVLHQARRRAGSFQLEIPKPHVTLTEDGSEAAGIELERQDESHNLIEECMLAANQAVACFLLEHGLPYIARVHPSPKPQDIEDFTAFLLKLGHDLPGGEFTPINVQSLLDDIGKEEGGPAVHLALLKSMQRASYSSEPAQHYALQMEYYSHFTSPIRRYPDLIAHQILDEFWDSNGSFAWKSSDPLAEPKERGNKQDASGRLLDAYGVPIGLVPDEQTRFELEMPSVAMDCSERTTNADYAERRATEMKILRWIEDNHLDRVLYATLMSTVKFGLFCQVDEFWIDGLVPMWSIDADAVYSQGNFGVDLTFGGEVARLRIGDRLKVRIVRADPMERELELQLAESLTNRKRGGDGSGDGGDKSRSGRISRRGRPVRSRREVSPDELDDGTGRPPRGGGDEGGGGGPPAAEAEAAQLRPETEKYGPAEGEEKEARRQGAP